MKILIAGSRTFKDHKKFKIEVDQILNTLMNDGIETKENIFIIGGKADGTDTLAAIYRDWFNYDGIDVPVTKDDWNTYGKKAGILRNVKMLDMLDDSSLVIAFWDGKSPGTGHTVSESRKRGLNLIVVDI